MRVKGSIQALQSNLDFCIKITSTGSIRSVEGLRKHFFGIFLSEEREQMKEMLLEKQNNELELEKEEITSEEEKPEELQEDMDSPFNSSFFLKQVQGMVKEDNTKYAPHGVYLDGIEILETKQSTQQEIQAEPEVALEQKEKFSIPQGYIEHGVILDDIENTEYREESLDNTSYTEHGVYLEDIKDIVVPSVFPEQSKDSNNEPLDESSENKIDVEESNIEEPSIEELLLNSQNVQKDEVVDLEEEYIVLEEPKVKLEVTKDEEPTDAPKEIRDFLRQHPNASIDFVSKFYSKKEISKQVKLGRIYKKNGKLMI